MFETIVVGTNWSESAELAFARALELARATGARVHVVSVDEGSPAPVIGGASRAPGVSTGFQADVALEQTLERLGATEVEVTQHTPTGAVAESIMAVAERQRADLIVVGSQGMRGARRMLGSVPNKISHHAPCDVLIVDTS